MRMKIALALVLLLQALPALAYIGPGSGISLLGGLWGVLVAIVLAVGAILIWPIRYMFRRLRRKRSGAASIESTESTEPTEPAEPAETTEASHAGESEQSSSRPE